MRKLTEIIIHCSATEEGKDFKAANIKKWHTLPPPKGRGWKDIGYHFVIDLDGTIEKGRPIEQIGAHCLGHNSRSVGVCYVGGLRHGKPDDTRTEEQKKALRKIVSELRRKYGVLEVHGHCEYANKKCPCFDVRKEF